MKKEIQEADKLAWGLLLLNALIWGSSFILVKNGLEVFSPIQVGLLRISITGISLLPFFPLYRKFFRDKRLKYILLFGLLNGGFPPFLFAFAQTRIDSALAGIINSLVPLFTLLIGVLVFSMHFSRKQTVGVFTGLAGACLLILFQGEFGAGISLRNIPYALLAVTASFLYAISNHVLKQYLQDVPAQAIMGLGFLCMLPITTIMLFSGDFIQKMQTGQPVFEALGYIAILGIVGTALALVIFGKLIQRSNALFASFITYIIPFVALFWGIIDGERLNALQLAGMALILAGIYLGNSKERAN